MVEVLRGTLLGLCRSQSCVEDMVEECQVRAGWTPPQDGAGPVPADDSSSAPPSLPAEAPFAPACCDTFPPDLACNVAVKASIFFSKSATRLSVFFCLFLVGAVTTQFLPAFRHRLHGCVSSLGSGSQRTLSPLQASHARAFLASSSAAAAAAADAPATPSPACRSPVCTVLGLSWWREAPNAGVEGLEVLESCKCARPVSRLWWC